MDDDSITALGPEDLIRYIPPIAKDIGRPMNKKARFFVNPAFTSNRYANLLVFSI